MPVLRPIRGAMIIIAASRWFLHRLISAVPPAQKQLDILLHTMILFEVIVCYDKNEA
jgi:hypothetical protein